MKRDVSLWAAIAVFALSGSLAAGQSVRASPTEVIKQSNARLVSILRPGKSATSAEQAEVLKIITETTDFPTVARTIFGARWDTVSDDQRRDFISYFSRLVGVAAIEKMGRARADQVRYLDEEIRANHAIVRTEAMFQGKHVPLDYSLTLIGGDWRVTDYRLDGVLSTDSYRKQFNRVLQKDTFADLLKRLKAKVAKSNGKSAGHAIAA